jgi:hypothetical protein
MTVQELIDELQDLVDDNPSLADEPANIAYQREYPLGAEVVAVNVVDSEQDDDCECETLSKCDHQSVPVLWIATEPNDEYPYAPRKVWRS